MLSLAQKSARVESAIKLKKVFCSAKHYGWRYILTGDELWFYFAINSDYAWVPEGTVTPTRPNKRSAAQNECCPFSGPRSAFPWSKFFQKDVVLMLNIYAIIFFSKSIESVQPPLTKMLDEKLSSISTMRPLTLGL
jgi:hypothetical protein